MNKEIDTYWKEHEKENEGFILIKNPIFIYLILATLVICLILWRAK